ncbi:hypothetical protein Goari_006143 [Gossypium aridum]|uniref:Uncharacterized protein n=1 Tax=Gossypium aridum TaxID=34290 RepID=A0A7J8XM67_GOSAI|nr:hypothetical protein [Gossypium aridum]
MTVAESVVKLGLGIDKLGSSKLEERGIRDKDHKEDIDGNGIGDNCGNGKPRFGKKKPNNKMDKLKCLLCNGPHILKKYPKKSALSKKEKLISRALGLGSSILGVKAKKAKSKKNLVECFLCHGLHRLGKCSKKSIIEGDDGANKEPKKLGLSKEKVKAKRGKRSKKKRIKCFFYYGSHELRNYPKQSKSVEVKEKATSELVESSNGLLHEEDMSLSSNLREQVVKKTMKLGPKRLNSSTATELVESLVRFLPKEKVSLALDSEEEIAMQTLKLGSMRLVSIDTSKGLPPMREVGYASNFGKVVMQVGQLTRLNATRKVYSQHYDSVLHSNLLTWQERRDPFEVLEQGGQETVGKAKPIIMN